MSDILYFAYGSNLHQQQMQERCADAEPVSPALLNGYELKERGYADISPAEGKWVNGALYRITPRDLEKLDRYEGFPYFYTRKEVMVTDGGGVYRKAWVYMMTPEYQQNNSRSYTDQYRSICSAGARMWGIPDAFGENLAETPSLFHGRRVDFAAAMTELTDFLARNTPRTAALWHGGKLIIALKPQKTTGSWNGFYPAPKVIVTDHALSVSWLLRELTSLLLQSGMMDCCTKFSFYKGIADTLQNALDRDPDITARELLLKMTDFTGEWVKSA